MGRKKIELDWEKFDTILQFKPSIHTCADILGVSHDTIENRIREEHDCTFSAYRDRKMGKVKLALQQKAISKARDGDNVMLIFCLKNLCGWADKHEQKIEAATIKIDISGDEAGL